MMKKKENLLNIFGNIADPENDPPTAKKFFRQSYIPLREAKVQSELDVRCTISRSLNLV